jgi:DNA gyrase/topoisomerase IV subunit A
MRYTEIRMSKIAHSLLADLDKETVDFVDNYDGTEQIPVVLPTRVPNLLVNGSSGIAVGMATNIPPHNLREVVAGCLATLQDPEISIEALMEFIPGPDFPRVRKLTVERASFRRIAQGAVVFMFGRRPRLLRMSLRAKIRLLFMRSRIS